MSVGRVEARGKGRRTAPWISGLGLEEVYELIDQKAIDWCFLECGTVDMSRYRAGLLAVHIAAHKEDLSIENPMLGYVYGFPTTREEAKPFWLVELMYGNRRKVVIDSSGKRREFKQVWIEEKDESEGVE